MYNKHDFDSTILADKQFLTLDTWKSHLNNNVIISGASGRGKTRSIIKPNIMQMNCNYVISDPKGQLIKELGTMLEKNGYKIKVLNLVDMKHSDSYNPFVYIKNSGDVYKLLEYLISNLTPPNARHSDPFWDQAARVLLSAICFYLIEECNPEDQTFSNVMKLLRCEEIHEYENYKSTLDIMFEDLAERKPESVAVKQHKLYKSCGTGKTASSILISAEVYLQHFNLPEYDLLTSSNTLEMERLSDEKVALFVITSDTDRSKNWLAGLFYSQLFDLLCNQENKRHIRFIMDDFVCTGYIPDFDLKLSMMRSRNLSCMIVIQDESQLEKDYGAAANGIIANCDSYIFLGSTSIPSCEAVSKRIGKDYLDAYHLRCLTHNQCVVISGSTGGIFYKYDLKNHPNYFQIADSPFSELYYQTEEKHNIPQI